MCKQSFEHFLHRAGPYIKLTSELEDLKRRRMREYRKKSKSVKYQRFKTEYKETFEKASSEFLRKNVDCLKDTNPGKAYSILRRV